MSRQTEDILWAPLEEGAPPLAASSEASNDATDSGINLPDWSEPWPDPQPFPVALASVPALQPDMLPEELASWAVDISERLSVPLDFVGVPAMIAAGSLIGRRVGIAPEQHTDWVEPANLWGLIVGSPGMLKSPAVRQALGPLSRLEAEAADDHRRASDSFAIDKALANVARSTAQSSAKKALKIGDRAAARAALECEMPGDEEPVWRRYMTNDGTPEKLGELLVDNPHGLLVHRDEALSLFRHLDREENAVARGFYLTGWAGSDSYTFDRIGRGTVHVKAVTLSFLGTTQPDVFSAYMVESLRERPDGMVQRMQLLAWPDAVDWHECDRPPNRDARNQAFGCFERLSNLTGPMVQANVDAVDTSIMPTLRFSPGASAMWKDWRAALECRLRAGDCAPAFAAHLSKYRGLVPRLALICHLAGDGRGPVSEEATAQSLAWAEYLEAHAVRAYGAGRLDAIEAARALWKRIARGDLPSGFTARMVKRKDWGGFNGERVDAALVELVDLDRLRSQPVETGGRPTERYWINPKAVAP